MAKVSIKDIASRAGVNNSTVSRALNNSPLISAETRERIQEMALAMGYKRDKLAQGLATGQSGTLGIVVNDIANPYVAEIIQGLEERASNAGYALILSSSHNEHAREISAIGLLHERRVDAIINVSSRIGSRYLREIRGVGVPIILVNSEAEFDDDPDSLPTIRKVGLDNVHGGYLATQHLISLGHKRIAYLSGSPHRTDDIGRHRGYSKAMKEAGLDCSDLWVSTGTGPELEDRQGLRNLLEKQVTAVFCISDRTAMGVLVAAQEKGISVPNDLAIVGFDNIPYSRYVQPALTTVAQPLVQIGQDAATMAQRLIRGDKNVQDIVYKGTLLVRDSSVRKPGT